MKVIYERQLKYVNSTIYYKVDISVKESDDSNYYNCFMNVKGILEENMQSVNMDKFADEDYLKEHNINFIIENDVRTGQTNIIPLGIVDFIDDEHQCNRISILTTNRNKELYMANQIIKNIKRAIQIKYEAKVFTEKFNKRQQFTIEEEDLYVNS